MLPLSGEVARSADRVKQESNDFGGNNHTLQSPRGASSPSGVPGEQGSPGADIRGAYIVCNPINQRFVERLHSFKASPFRGSGAKRR